MLNLENTKKEMEQVPPDNSKKVFEDLISRIDEDIEKYMTFPDEYKLFFLEILSNEHIYNKVGLVYFSLFLTENIQLVDKYYYDKLRCVFFNYYNKYKDYLFKLDMICIFAYYYHDYKETKQFFEKLQELEGENITDSLADEGFRLLENERNRREFAKEN